MREALYWRILDKEKRIIQCTLCPHLCTLKASEVGKCNVRQNIKGTLFSLVYGKPVSLANDPIEKKPLFHFLPGSRAFSLGTYGCNFDCQNCQNFEIARGKPDEHLRDFSPAEIVRLARESGAESIAYTYTEPTIFYEYVLDIAKRARKAGLKNILVTNGFINQEPLQELIPLIDAANVDLKGDDEHYKKICAGRVAPVIATLRALHAGGIHLEVTNLIIPSVNDSVKDLRFIAKTVAAISKDIPLHFSAFHPMYKMINIKTTPIKTLHQARDLAKKEGMRYIYLGNVAEGSDTICPRCAQPILRREGYTVFGKELAKGECRFCGERIYGLWD